MEPPKKRAAIAKGLRKRRTVDNGDIPLKRLSFDLPNDVEDLTRDAEPHTPLARPLRTGTPRQDTSHPASVATSAEPQHAAKNQLKRFDLTAWRPCKITYREGDTHMRIAHACETDGSGRNRSFNMPLQRMRKLLAEIPRLGPILEEMQSGGQQDVKIMIHLGGKTHARVYAPFACLNVRNFERGRNGLYPTADGIALRAGEVMNLGNYVTELDTLIDDAGVLECFHGNQMAELECRECTPFPENDDDDDDY